MSSGQAGSGHGLGSGSGSGSPPPSPSLNRGRRASLASGSFTEMFSRPAAGHPPPALNTSTSNTIPIFNPTSAAQQQQQRRRMSLTTLGLSGSPTNQQLPFTGPAPATTSTRNRRGSVSSSVLSSSPNLDQAVIEEDEGGDPDTPMTSPTSPFARRVSFGARNGIYNPTTSGSFTPMNKQRSTSFNHFKPPGTQNIRTASISGRNALVTPPASPCGNAGDSGGTTRASSASTSQNHTQNVNINRSNRSSSSSWRQIGEGFNWPEALRTRAERAPSLTGAFPGSTSPSNGHAHGHSHGHGPFASASNTSPTSSTSPSNSMASSFSSASNTNSRILPHHHRAASIATMEAMGKPPPKELLERHPSSPPLANFPQQQSKAKSRPKPDYFQEKILRADFMD
ncbi:hypothetical protein FQN57_004598 [Myotisia sp. PD_48]|nr:hypothetical protein FQN57_004598 [Myotisia sp. PD_48]